jgi:hypothetical protein
MKDKWYVTKLILQCRVNDDRVGPWTCDEQVRVLRAKDDDTAYEKALRLGREAEDSYQNVHGETVSWEFVGLANLDELGSPSIRDGTEITSRLFTEEEPARLVRQKERLVVYWMQQEKHRTAREILEERERRADEGGHN